MRAIIAILFALLSAPIFAQPSISSTTRWQVMDGNSVFVMDVADIEAYFLEGVNKMNTTTMNALSSPADGWNVYNTDTKGVQYYNGTRWQRPYQSSGTPTFTIGTGWGSGATSSIEGTDLSGRITVNSGTGTITATTLGTVTFNKTFPTGAKYAVLFGPANDASRAANIMYMFPNSIVVGSFVCDINNTNITNRIGPSSTYIVFYHVVQYE